MDAFEALRQLAQQGCGADIITLISTPDIVQKASGQMLVVSEVSGSVGQIVDTVFTTQILQYIKSHSWSRPTILELDYNGSYTLFWDQLAHSPHVLVLGAGHISQPLVELLAMIDYQVTVVDDRPDFANTVRFPKAAQIICENFERFMQTACFANFSAIIIVTRGHRYDLDCLRIALQQPARYLGMIGSQRRVKSIVAMLLEEGVAPEALKQLRAPIGVDIGAQSPAEIAVSIVAEIIAVERGGSYLPLSHKRRSKDGD